MNDFWSKSYHRNHCIYSEEELEGLMKRKESSYPNAILNIRDEEEILLQYYHGKIPQIIKHFKYPVPMIPLAHWYFFRFFLTESANEHDPKHVMLTCILLASKMENLHLTMSQFIQKFPKTDQNMIFALEFRLLEVLQFEINFFNPLNSLYAICIDFGKIGKDLFEECKTTLFDICETKLILILSPTKIALSAISHTLTGDALDAFKIYHKEKQDSLYDNFNPWTDDGIIKNSFYPSKPLPMDTIKELDKRLLESKKLK